MYGIGFRNVSVCTYVLVLRELNMIKASSYFIKVNMFVGSDA